MSSGVQMRKFGSRTGTAANLDIKTVGFRPRKVKLINQTGLCVMEWTESMKDGEGYKMITAGTNSYVTTGGITPLSNGFRIGTDADINASGELIHWEASE